MALAGLRGNKAVSFAVLSPAALAAAQTREELNALPHLPAPTALAVVTAVAASAYVEPNRGLISLVALGVLLSTSLQVVHARICTTRCLVVRLARTFKFFGLRDYVCSAFPRRATSRKLRYRVWRACTRSFIVRVVTNTLRQTLWAFAPNARLSILAFTRTAPWQLLAVVPPS